MLDAIVVAKRSLATLSCATAIFVAWQMWPAASPVQRRHEVTTIVVKPPPPRQPVHVARGTSGCLGDTLDATFTVHPNGTVDWRQPHMPLRQLSLLPDELELLDKLGARESREEPSYHVGWYRVVTGNPTIAEVDPSLTDAEGIPASSVAGVNLDEVFDAAQARYRHAVLGLGTLRGSFVARDGGRTYRVEVEGNRIDVKRGKRVVYTRELDDAELVDLIDQIRMTTPAPVDKELRIARGKLAIAGIEVALDISYAERGPLSVIEQMVHNGSYCDRERCE